MQLTLFLILSHSSPSKLWDRIKRCSYCPSGAWDNISSLNLGVVNWGQLYGTSSFCHLGPLKCFNFSRVDTSFMGPTLNAPLSWWVDGIVGQTNTLSDLLSMWVTAMQSIRALGAASDRCNVTKVGHWFLNFNLISNIDWNIGAYSGIRHCLLTQISRDLLSIVFRCGA